MKNLPVKNRTDTKKFKVIKAVLELILNDDYEDTITIELFGKDDTEDFADIFNKHLLQKGNFKHHRLSDVEKTSRVKQYIRKYKDEFGSKSFIDVRYAKTMDGTAMLYTLRGIWSDVHCKNNFKEIKELIRNRLEQGYLCFEENMEDKKNIYTI